MTLDIKLDREPVVPKDAATIILVRDGVAGLEVFCVERSKQSRFVGGAIVFPGGKLDPSDYDEAWAPLTTDPRATTAGHSEPFTKDDAHLRALAIAACRETLEEATLLFVRGEKKVTDAELLALRETLTEEPGALRSFLTAHGLQLDLGELHAFARWVTPTAEARRFDTRFFLGVAPAEQTGRHDDYETTASFWARPADILARNAKNEVTLLPPTNRSLTLLADCADTKAAIALSAAANLSPICPRIVPAGDSVAIVLPGDPEHDVREPRVPGHSRFVKRGDQWLPSDA